jgi:hypothetical protein
MTSDWCGGFASGQWPMMSNTLAIAAELIEQDRSCLSSSSYNTQPAAIVSNE